MSSFLSSFSSHFFLAQSSSPVFFLSNPSISTLWCPYGVPIEVDRSIRQSRWDSPDLYGAGSQRKEPQPISRLRIFDFSRMFLFECLYSFSVTFVADFVCFHVGTKWFWFEIDSVISLVTLADFANLHHVQYLLYLLDKSSVTDR